MPTLTRMNSVSRQLFVERMVTENTALVHHIVRKRLKYLDWESQDYEDATQCGLMAMHRAATLFNRGIGVKFSTYAYRAILNELTRWEADRNKVRGYNNRNKNKTQRPLIVQLRTVGDDECECLATREQEDDDQSQKDRQDQYQRIQTLMRSLDPRTQAIVMGYHYRGLTLRELGETWNLSRERIRQIVEKGLDTLRYRANIGRRA